MADLFPNLPKSKVCPECKRRFKWPFLPNGTRMSKRNWFKRTYCSRACSLVWFKRTEGLDG